MAKEKIEDIKKINDLLEEVRSKSKQWLEDIQVANKDFPKLLMQMQYLESRDHYGSGALYAYIQEFKTIGEQLNALEEKIGSSVSTMKTLQSNFLLTAIKTIDKEDNE